MSLEPADGPPFPPDSAAPLEKKPEPQKPATEAKKTEAPEASSPEPKKPGEPQVSLEVKPHKAELKPKPSAVPLISTFISLALLVIGALLYGFHWRSKNSPKALLLASAQKYLSFLQAHDYTAAYSMLSSESRKSFSEEDFKQSQDSVPWSFSAMEMEDFGKDRALVRYNLRVNGKDPQRDWLRFLQEDDKWVRAYWWNLSRKIEDALEANDQEAAFATASAAVQIDPYDPMAHSYLCEALYAKNDFGRAEQECLQTLELAKRFPSDLNENGLYHIHAILGDLYKNHLARSLEAIRHFDILLALPGLRAPQRCEISLARAEACYMAQDYPQAISGLRAAGKVCSDPDAQDFAKRAIRILDGQAGQEAVAILKNHPMPDGKMTYLEWRQNEADERIRKAATAQAAASITRDEEAWVPEHLGSSLYKVSLRAGTMDILNAQLDLWTRTVKVDIHVR